MKRKNPEEFRLRAPDLKEAFTLGFHDGTLDKIAGRTPEHSKTSYQIRRRGFTEDEKHEYTRGYYAAKMNPNAKRVARKRAAPRRALKNGRVVIYGRLLRIEAQKTQPHVCDAGCKRVHHRYYHNFKPGAVIYGLANGDLLIQNRR